jgi:hypothetical protein
MKRLDLCCAFCKSIAKNGRFVDAFDNAKKNTKVWVCFLAMGKI